MSVLKDRIRTRRKDLGLSQEDLAFYLKTNQRQVSRYETGENDPTGDVLIQLARALDTTTDWLLGLSDERQRPLDRTTDLEADERNIIAALRRGKPFEAIQIISGIHLSH